MIIKSILLKNLFIAILGVSTITAGNNAKSEQNTIVQNSKTVQVNMISVSNKTYTNLSSIKSKLEKAKKAGKAVFIVVTGTGSTDTEKALKIANGAKAIYKNSVVLQMSRDDANNADLVKKWRLSGAPLPLILVVSTKGLLTGGRILKEATSANIAELVPSPKLELVYEALSNKKHAIVVFTKKSFTDKTAVIKVAKDAVNQLKGKAIFVEVNMDDKAEAGFMKQLHVNNAKATASTTFVINNQGQVAGTATGIPNAQKLVTAAKTPVKSGCGPGCGPQGCN